VFPREPHAVWRAFSGLVKPQGSKIILAFEIGGTASSMLAAALLAFQAMPLNILYLFWLFGSVSLTISSILRKNQLLTLLMLFYTGLNLYGLWSFG